MKKRTETVSYLEFTRAIRTLNKRRKASKATRWRASHLKGKKPSLIGSNGQHLSMFRNVASRRRRKSSVSRPILRVRIPKNFSIIDNPEETLKTIAKVALESTNDSLKFIHFDHSDLEHHDLGAEMLLGGVTKELKHKARLRNRGVLITGTFPQSERQKRLIKAMGVIKKLGIEDHLIREGQANIEIFDFKGTKDTAVRLGSEDRKNRCGRTFVGHLNKCLNYSNRQLTGDSVGRLLDFVGEIVGNAEDHSGQIHWFVSGYLDDTRTDTAGELHFCEILIYNFGNSIAKTFQDLPQNSYAYSLIKPYLTAHRRKGYFRWGWHEDDLITLAALQSHISSKHLSNDSDRGQGTVDLIEFFQQVARECAEDLAMHASMCILSGRTHILFNDKYRLRRNEDGREIIAFNLDNDLNQPPDPNNVKHLNDAWFPGTMISIRFPLTSGLTEETGSKGSCYEKG